MCETIVDNVSLFGTMLVKGDPPVLVIDLASDRPLAEQVESGLRGAIAKGEVAPGDRMPTARQLAGDLGISLNTVARAYRAMEADGLVSTVRGRGTVVSSARQTNAGSAAARESVLAKLQEVVSDARLAGLTRKQFDKLAADAARGLWDSA